MTETSNYAATAPSRRKLLSGTTEICSAVLGPKGVRTAVTQTAFSQTGQQDSDYHITLPVSLSISETESHRTSQSG